MLRHPPSSPLFPYTTLFRSMSAASRTSLQAIFFGTLAGSALLLLLGTLAAACRPIASRAGSTAAPPCSMHGRIRHSSRSEEHTSELQSLAYLVCRLLLEKKK